MTTYLSVNDFMRRFVEASSEYLKDFEDVYSAFEIEEIPSKASSGYIPFTSGGFLIIVPAFFSLGSIPACLEETYNSLIEDCFKDFCRYRRLSASSYDDLSEELQEKYFDYELEYINEGPPYFYKAVAYLTKDRTAVCVRAYLNDDFKYARDFIPWLAGGTDCTHGPDWEEIPVTELTEERLQNCIRKMQDTFSNI